MNLPTPSVEYGLLLADADRLRSRHRRRARRGVRAHGERRYPVQVVLSLGRPGRRVRRGGAGGPRSARRGRPHRGDRRCRRRRPGAVPAGHDPAGRRSRHPADRRATASPRDAESESESGVRGLDSFTPQASAMVGSVAEKLPTKAGVMQTEVFPLTMFADRRHAAVPGGRRPADDVHRARGAVAAAVSDVRAGPPPPAAVAGSRAEILSARRVLVGVLPVRRGDAVRLRRHAEPVGDRRRGPRQRRARRRWR